MNDWFIPMVDMKQTDRQRKKRDKRTERALRKSELLYCLKCEVVYQRGDFEFRKKVNADEFEYYPKGNLSSYKLKRKVCSRCT